MKFLSFKELNGGQLAFELSSIQPFERVEFHSLGVVSKNCHSLESKASFYIQRDMVSPGSWLQDILV